MSRFLGRLAGFASLIFVANSCSWMSSDAASRFAGERVLTREEAAAYLDTAIYQNAEECPNLLKPGLFMIDTGFDYVFTRPFYRKDSLDLCFLALRMTPCPAAGLSDADAIDLYRFVLKTCNPRPFEI